MLNKLFKKFLYGITFFFAILFIGLFLSIFRELNFQTVFEKFFLSELFFAVKLSFYTATTSAVLSIIAGIPVAYFLSRFDFRGKEILNTIFDLTNVLSPIAIGAMVLIFFNTGPGRFIEENIGSFVFEVRGIILAQFLIVFGYSIRFLKNNFESLDRDYENIARTLGAGPFDLFIRVVLPLSYRGIISAFLLVWARAMGEFGATVTIAGATTMKTETLPVAIFLKFESADIYAALLFILVLILFSLFVLFFIRKILKVNFI